jgi:hypothetical protein
MLQMHRLAAERSEASSLGLSEMLRRGPNGRFRKAAPQRPIGRRMSVQGRKRMKKVRDGTHAMIRDPQRIIYVM